MEGKTVGLADEEVLCHGHMGGQRLSVALVHVAEVVLVDGLLFLELLFFGSTLVRHACPRVCAPLSVPLLSVLLLAHRLQLALLTEVPLPLLLEETWVGKVLRALEDRLAATLKERTLRCARPGWRLNELRLLELLRRRAGPVQARQAGSNVGKREVGLHTAVLQLLDRPDARRTLELEVGGRALSRHYPGLQRVQTCVHCRSVVEEALAHGRGAHGELVQLPQQRHGLGDGKCLARPGLNLHTTARRSHSLVLLASPRLRGMRSALAARTETFALRNPTRKTKKRVVRDGRGAGGNRAVLAWSPAAAAPAPCRRTGAASPQFLSASPQFLSASVYLSVYSIDRCESL
jgi:hypothetical protein